MLIILLNTIKEHSKFYWAEHFGDLEFTGGNINIRLCLDAIDIQSHMYLSAHTLFVQGVWWSHATTYYFNMLEEIR